MPPEILCVGNRNGARNPSEGPSLREAMDKRTAAHPGHGHNCHDAARALFGAICPEMLVCKNTPSPAPQEWGNRGTKPLPKAASWCRGRARPSVVAVSLHPESQIFLSLRWRRGHDPFILQWAGNRNPEFQPSCRKTQRPVLSPILPTH